MSDATGSVILDQRANNSANVRQMRKQGTSNAPLAAQRSPYGTITVLTSTGSGSITAVTVNGVNQLGSAVPVSSASVNVVAAALATALNSSTPVSGPKSFWSSVGGVVYMQMPTSVGTAFNGMAITVTKTGITTSTTAINYGTSASGTYDSTYGYRFWINTSGTSTSLVGATEITEYLTVRGIESGFLVSSPTINSDTLTSLGRSSAITVMQVNNEAAASTDLLAFIDTTGFIEGDQLVLSAAVSGKTTTVEDATNSTSSIPFKNIYLTGAVPFDLNGHVSMTLRFKFDSVLGPIWIEQGRATTGTGAVVTLAQMQSLIAAGSLVTDQMYYITDVHAGMAVLAMGPSSVSAAASLNMLVPDYNNTLGTFGEVWNAGMSAPTINNYYAWNGQTFKSLTGLVGSPPDSDFTNWLSVANPITITVSAKYDWYYSQLVEVSDLNGNRVSASYSYTNYSGFDAIGYFQWGHPDVWGNTVDSAFFNILNQTGSVYCNNVSELYIFDGNNFPDASKNMAVSGNTLSGAVSPGVYNNTFYYFQGNTIIGGSVYGNTCQIISGNIVNGGVIYNNTSTITNTTSITNGVYNLGAQLSGCTLNNASSISGVMSSCILSGATISASTSFTANLQHITLDSASVTSSCNITIDGASNGAWSTITSETFTSADDYCVSTPLGSNFKRTLDCDDAGIFSAGTLTIPTKYKYVGIFTLTSAAFVTITKMANGAYFPLRFLVANGKTEKYTPQAIGGAASGSVVANSTTTVVLTGRTNGSDEFTVVRDGTLYKVINSTVLA